MSLSREERAERRAAFRRMNGQQKAAYIFAYYKLPIFLGVVALAILVSTVHRQLTKKEAALYAAFINVSVGDSLDRALTTQFVEQLGLDARKHEIYCYRELYLSDDASFVNHEYAYASRLKLLGAINAGKLDVVLMNREAYDIFSHNGYLLDLAPLLADGAPEALLPLLTSNEVILEDNAIEVGLNEADTYRAVTETVANAVELSDLALFRDAGFSGAVYLGIVANSARVPTAEQYLAYLSGALS